MFTYILIDAAIIAFPLLLSFEKRIKYYRNIKALAISILAIGGLFILLDEIAVLARVWWFNSAYILKISLWSLPLEEALFFVVVPYSCIFIYEIVSAYLPFKKTGINLALMVAVALMAFLSIWLLWGKTYSVVVLLYFITLNLLLFIDKNSPIYSNWYWLWISICMALFLIFNLILTGLPVVLYNPDAISNIRFIFIPIEDFIYNYCLLTSYLWAYLHVKNK